jgi:Galactose oxidase, central domain
VFVSYAKKADAVSVCRNQVPWNLRSFASLTVIEPHILRFGTLFLLASGALLSLTIFPPVANSTPVARWKQITNPPPARTSAQMAYDSRRHRVLVFGGCKRFGAISDLWSLTLTPPSEWSELSPWWAGPASGSCDSRVAVYDSLSDEVLIASPGVYYGGPGDTLAIFAYSFGGVPGWRRLETTGSGPPKPSAAVIMVLDPGERRLILISEQIWALALDGPMTWTRFFPTGSGPSLIGAAAALDAPHRRVLVNGGGPFGAPFLTATWALDLTGPMRWDALDVASMPTGRREHVAIHDPTRNRLVVAGGYSGTELLDAWALDLTAGTWNQVAFPIPEIAKRRRASAVYDPHGDAMVIFGGSDASNDLVETVRLPFETPTWTVDPPTAEPVHNASMVHDDHQRRMLLFGGLGSQENARDRLYSLDLATEPPRWSRVLVAGSQPVRRFSHMAAWDPIRHRMFVFGGQVDATLLNDLWYYSEDPTPQWIQVTPAGALPSARAAGALAYDPQRDRLVLMGGRSDMLDVWELPLSGPTALQWRALAPSGMTPTTRRSMALVYDPVRDRLLMVAGVDAGGNGRPTYALEFGAGGDGIWTAVASGTGPYAPVTMLRGDSVVVYDEYSAHSPLETKQLTLAAPESWRTVEVATATPRRRLDHCGAYDYHEDRLIIFGGQIMPYSDSDRRWFADTWALSWFNPSTVSVDPGAAPKRDLLSIPSPNPARDQITVELSRPRPGPGSLELLDIHGRRVMVRMLDADFASGSVVIRLDHRLPSGIYLLRLVGEPLSAARRFCVLR